MANIRPDKYITTSDAAGFGFSSIKTITIPVSGAVGVGGRTFTSSASINPDAFCVGYYKVKGSEIVDEDTIIPIGSGYSAVDNALGMTTYVRTYQVGNVINVNVILNNYSDEPQTAPTQTVAAIIYEFAPPIE